MFRRLLMITLATVFALTGLGIGAAQAAYEYNEGSCDFGSHVYIGWNHAQLSAESGFYYIEMYDWGWNTNANTTFNRAEMRTRFGTDNDGGVRGAAGGTVGSKDDVPSSGFQTINYIDYRANGPRQWKFTAWDGTGDGYCTTGWRNFS